MIKFSREQIESRVKSIIAEVTGYDETLLTSEIRLTPDEDSDKAINIGSLELAELLIILDEEFHVDISDAVASTLNTIDKLVDYIIQHMPVDKIPSKL